jgi:hypothetical protein
MKEDEKLIPDLQNWRNRNSANFSISDWTSIEGNIKLAIGYSYLFWPDFIEYDDCVFLKDAFSVENFKEWTKTEYVVHFAQIESVINHIHILDLFTSEKQDEITYEQIKYLGNKIREIYNIKLKSDFPNRKFEVLFNGDEQLENLLDYELTFFQEANEKRKLNDCS